MDKLTLREYQTLCRAKNLQLIDEDYRLHKQAWLNIQAGAQKEKGTGKARRVVPVYKRFRDFYDYEQALIEAGALKPKPSKFEALSRHLKDKKNEHK